MSGGSDMPWKFEERIDRLSPDQRVLLTRRLTGRPATRGRTGDADVGWSRTWSPTETSLPR